MVLSLHAEGGGRGGAMKSRAQRGAAVITGLLVVLCSSSARARHHEPAHADGAVCVATYRKALDRIQAAHLREAQELFAACARATCAESLRQECAARRLQLNADIPSVVPLAAD